MLRFHAQTDRRPPADHGVIAASLMHATTHVLADTHFLQQSPTTVRGNDKFFVSHMAGNSHA